MPFAIPKATDPLNTGPPLSPGMQPGPPTVTQVGEQGPPHSAPGGAYSVSSTSAQL
jgi:hypothetical protein